MSIDESGFLSPDIDLYRAKSRLKYEEFFALIGRAGKCCHSTKTKFTVHNRDGQEVFAVGLFLKLLADVEAATLLLEMCMFSQARSLLRVGIEGSINLAKVCKQYEFAHAFAVVAEQERLKLIKGIRQEPDGWETLASEFTDSLVAEIEATVENKPKAKLRNWANDVNMRPIYAAQYRMFSADVHSGPASLSPFFIMNSDDEIKGINWGPEIKDDCRPELLEAARLYITGLALTSKLFNVGVDQEADPIYEEYKRLVALVAEAKVSRFSQGEEPESKS